MSTVNFKGNRRTPIIFYKNELNIEEYEYLVCLISTNWEFDKKKESTCNVLACRLLILHCILYAFRKNNVYSVRVCFTMIYSGCLEKTFNANRVQYIFTKLFLKVHYNFSKERAWVPKEAKVDKTKKRATNSC